MMSKVILSPSILNASFDNIEEEVAKAAKAGAQYIHLDVMDGRFVPAVTFGAPFVKRIAKIKGIVKDVHLMIEEPLKHIDEFIDAGSDIITFHLEACEGESEVLSCISKIKKAGLKVGISIKPKTPVESIYPYIKNIDMVLVMSVEPGKGGQGFISESTSRIALIRAKIEELGSSCLIEVDGGINKDTGRLVVEAGATVLVAGTYLYGHDDFDDRAKGLLAL